MINDPVKRLAAGFWKLLAGIALVLLLVTQYTREPEQSEQLPTEMAPEAAPAQP